MLIFQQLNTQIHRVVATPSSTAYDDWVCCAQLVCSDVLPSVLLDISPASFRKRKITHAKQKSSVEGD